jgi:hypothetical protein
MFTGKTTLSVGVAFTYPGFSIAEAIGVRIIEGLILSDHLLSVVEFLGCGLLTMHAPFPLT